MNAIGEAWASSPRDPDSPLGRRIIAEAARWAMVAVCRRPLPHGLLGAPLDSLCMAAAWEALGSWRPGRGASLSSWVWRVAVSRCVSACESEHAMGSRALATACAIHLPWDGGAPPEETLSSPCWLDEAMDEEEREAEVSALRGRFRRLAEEAVAPMRRDSAEARVAAMGLWVSSGGSRAAVAEGLGCSAKRADNLVHSTLLAVRRLDPGVRRLNRPSAPRPRRPQTPKGAAREAAREAARGRRAAKDAQRSARRRGVAEALRAGRTLRQAASELGVSLPTVFLDARAMGLTSPRPHGPGERRRAEAASRKARVEARRARAKAVEEMLLAGRSQADACRATGCSPTTACRINARLGLPRRSRQKNPKKKRGETACSAEHVSHEQRKGIKQEAA